MDPQEISEKDIFHEGHSIQTAKYSPITLEIMMQNDHLSPCPAKKYRMENLVSKESSRGSMSERYLADPALLMIKFSLISLSFESLLSESNILSSPNIIVTLDHGIGIWFK